MVGKSPQSYLENACDSGTVLNASVVSGWLGCADWLEDRRFCMAGCSGRFPQLVRRTCRI